MAEGDGDEKASGSAPAVFISCASQDAAIANSIGEHLEQHGLRCWLAPRDVKPGTQYADAIVGAINEARAVVLLLSQNAVASSHVGREVERAASKHKPIIAFRIDAATLSRALEYFLSESQWIDVPAIGMRAALAKLAEAVGQASGQTVATDPVASTKPLQRTGERAKLIAGAAVLVSIGVTVALGVHFWSPSHKAAPPPAAVAMTDKSIAVLPFADLSERHDQAYFAEGLAQELVDVLGKLPDLRVIGHASSFQFKGKTDDLSRVGAELGAAHLVEGGVRRSGNRIRVTAQLVRASDGTHEWSGTYDRSVDDLLQVQTEIAMSLGRALQLSVADLHEARTAERVSAEVYDLYLRGLHANDRTSDEGIAEASNYLRRAIELDPHFVRAHEQLAITHLLQAVFGAVPADISFGQVRHDAARLLELDPSSGWGQTLLCRYNTEYSWDWSEAERQCAAALELAPRFWLALYAAADLALIRGEYGQSERLFKEIFPIDPLNADTYMELGLTLQAVGRFAEAETALRRGLAITPTYITGHFALGSNLLAEGRIEDARQAFELEAPRYGQQAGLAMAYHASGRNADAATALEHFLQDHGKEQPMIVAGTYSYLGDANNAFDWLERAYRQKDPLMPYIKGDLRMQSLAHDPRYKAFLRKMNLPE